jgi:ribulose-5-phosphate 4-epimerase/fuculose-1-phosphate aldolase
MTVHQVPEKAIRDRVSAEEWQIRVDLAAAYRLFAHFRWDDLIFTHITARVPGDEHHFLINPYGMMFDEITASSLVKIDLNGNVVLDNGYPVNPAGFVIHSAIHEARHEIGCVMHAHTPSSIAVSALKDGLLPLSQQATFVLQSLAYHDYEGIAVDADEKKRLVADIGDKVFLILRNHGMLTVGRTVADAFLAMYTLEAACRIQLLAQSAGSELVPVPQTILEGVESKAGVVLLGMGSALVWPALMRKLDRIDPGFRD